MFWFKATEIYNYDVNNLMCVDAIYLFIIESDSYSYIAIVQIRASAGSGFGLLLVVGVGFSVGFYRFLL